MTQLSELVDEDLVTALREALATGQFPGITFTHAMEFLLSDGILPASDLPIASFLKLEDWVRARAKRPHS